MCVRTIIDTNMFGELLSDPVRPLLQWIERKDGVLVYPDGGKYHDELRRGRFIRRSRVAEEEEHVAARNLRSDDPHIVALARASGALVLCTDDADLKSDFTDGDLLPPVGGDTRAVYPLPRPPDRRSGLGPGRGIERTQRDFLDRRKCAGRQRR